MQDAYGDMYERVEKSYDAGDFEGDGFSWEGLKEAWDKDAGGVTAERSEERRVGKECRSRGWPYH